MSKSILINLSIHIYMLGRWVSQTTATYTRIGLSGNKPEYQPIISLNRGGESMGGYGSTRWNWHNKRMAVEDCRKLPLSVIKKYLNVGWGSDLTWSRNGEKIASIGYRVKGVDDSPSSVLLVYTITKADGEKVDCNYPVGLTTTPLPWGGSRYWFICPIVGCGRRVSVLYLAPGGKYFACRHCNRLSYQSRQDGSSDRAFFQQMANMMQDKYPAVTWRTMKEAFRR